MKKTIFLSLMLPMMLMISCNNQDKKSEASNEEQAVISNETAEPTFFGKWRLVGFEMDGKTKFDECDAQTIWDFQNEAVGVYQGRTLYRLVSKSEDPACRLYGFESEWEEWEEGENAVYIENIKVGKGTNKGGMFKVEKLTTKELVLRGGTWSYMLER